jgi:hypothetical protein
MAVSTSTRFDPEWMESWRRAVNVAPPLPVIGRTFTCSFLIGFGDDEYVVAVNQGRIEGIDVGPSAEMRTQFSLRAPTAMWERFLEDPPPPMFNDIWAMNWHVAHPDGQLLRSTGICWWCGSTTGRSTGFSICCVRRDGAKRRAHGCERWRNP